MSPDLTLWLILGAVTLVSGMRLALLSSNERIAAVTDDAIRREGLAGIPAGCLMALAGVATVSLWVVYAVQVDDWRFAAIPGVPFTFHWIGKAAARRSPSRQRDGRP